MSLEFSQEDDDTHNQNYNFIPYNLVTCSCDEIKMNTVMSFHTSKNPQIWQANDKSLKEFTLKVGFQKQQIACIRFSVRNIFQVRITLTLENENAEVFDLLEVCDASIINAEDFISNRNTSIQQKVELNGESSSQNMPPREFNSCVFYFYNKYADQTNRPMTINYLEICSPAIEISDSQDLDMPNNKMNQIQQFKQDKEMIETFSNDNKNQSKQSLVKQSTLDQYAYKPGQKNNRGYNNNYNNQFAQNDDDFDKQIQIALKESLRNVDDEPQDSNKRRMKMKQRANAGQIIDDVDDNNDLDLEQFENEENQMRHFEFMDNNLNHSDQDMKDFEDEFFESKFNDHNNGDNDLPGTNLPNTPMNHNTRNGNGLGFVDYDSNDVTETQVLMAQSSSPVANNNGDHAQNSFIKTRGRLQQMTLEQMGVKHRNGGSNNLNGKYQQEDELILEHPIPDEIREENQLRALINCLELELKKKMRMKIAVMRHEVIDLQDHYYQLRILLRKKDQRIREMEERLKKTQEENGQQHNLIQNESDIEFSGSPMSLVNDIDVPNQQDAGLDSKM
eukprot:403332248